MIKARKTIVIGLVRSKSTRFMYTVLLKGTSTPRVNKCTINEHHWHLLHLTCPIIHIRNTF